MLKLNYNGAQMVLEALQDYLKGPEFIEQDMGEKLLKEHSKLNEKFVSLNEFQGVEWNLPEIGCDVPRKRLDTLWYRITYNGHRLWPEKWLKKEPGYVMFDYTYTPQKYVRRATLYAVNPALKVAAVRHHDNARYKRLKKEWNQAVKKYKKENNSIRRLYLEKKGYLTSLEFWKKYLEI